MASENQVVVLSALLTVAALLVLGVVDSSVGFPGEWSVVATFVLFVGLAYVLPQVYLMRVDESTSSVSRLGVITLMLLLFAAIASNVVSGTEQSTIWGLVGIWSIVIFGFEVRAGYRESQQQS